MWHISALMKEKITSQEHKQLIYDIYIILTYQLHQAENYNARAKWWFSMIIVTKTVAFLWFQQIDQR